MVSFSRKARDKGDSAATATSSGWGIAKLERGCLLVPSCGTERQMSMKSKMWNMQIGSLVGLRSFDELNSLESSIGLRAQTMFGNFVNEGGKRRGWRRVSKHCRMELPQDSAHYRSARISRPSSMVKRLLTLLFQEARCQDVLRESLRICKERGKEHHDVIIGHLCECMLPLQNVFIFG